MNYYFIIPTDFGDMLASINEDSFVTGLWFVGQKHYPSIDPSQIHHHVHTCPPSVTQTRLQLIQELEAYACGSLKHFHLRIKPQGTPFQEAIWHLLTTIEYGTTTTYGALAKKIALQLDRPSMSAQAVGQAVGRNPLTIIIPCHRVLGSDGTITGYAGGTDRKIRLLQLEGSLSYQ